MDLNAVISRVKPQHTTVTVAVAATHTVLAPAGVGLEWIIDFIDLTATDTGANTVVVYMGNNAVWTCELFVAGDYRVQTPDAWRCGNNQPLLVSLSAAKGVTVNVSHYNQPAYA